MADTLQSLGLLKPDFTTLPPDFQGNPGALVNPQAYADALRQQDALAGEGDQPPIDFRQQVARVLQAYGGGQGQVQGGPSTPLVRNPDRPPAAPPAAAPQSSRHHVLQQLPDAFANGVTGPLIPLSDPHFDDRIRELTHDKPSAGSVPIDRRNSPPPKRPEQPWYRHGIQDGAAGLLSGVLSIPETVVSGVAWLQEHPTVAAALGAAVPLELSKAAGITPSATRSTATDMDRWARSLAYDPNSMMFKGGDFVGSVAPTFLMPEAPLISGIPRLARAVAAARAAKITGKVVPWMTRMGAGLARYGDIAVNGGIAGALSSHGKNIVENAVTSAALGPVFGVVADRFLLPWASRANKAISDLRYEYRRHTPGSFVDAIIAGKGGDDSPQAIALWDYFSKNKGPAIEAKFSQRADQATRAGPDRPVTPIDLRRPAATINEARAAASEFVGQPIIRSADGATVTATNNSLRKWRSGKAVSASDSVKNHAKAMANADDLFRSGEPFVKYLDPRGGDLIIDRSSAYFNAPDGVYGVKMTAKNTPNSRDPNPLYTIQTMPVGEPQASAATVAALANALNGVAAAAADSGQGSGGSNLASSPPDADDDQAGGRSDQGAANAAEWARALQLAEQPRPATAWPDTPIPGARQRRREQQPVSRGRNE